MEQNTPCLKRCWQPTLRSWGERTNAACAVNAQLIGDVHLSHAQLQLNAACQREKIAALPVQEDV